MIQVVECLPSKYEALSSIPQYHKERKTNELIKNNTSQIEEGFFSEVHIWLHVINVLPKDFTLIGIYQAERMQFHNQLIRKSKTLTRNSMQSLVKWSATMGTEVLQSGAMRDDWFTRALNSLVG
jgi:hypothetical protein